MLNGQNKIYHNSYGYNCKNNVENSVIAFSRRTVFKDKSVHPCTENFGQGKQAVHYKNKKIRLLCRGTAAGFKALVCNIGPVYLWHNIIGQIIAFCQCAVPGNSYGISVINGYNIFADLFLQYNGFMSGKRVAAGVGYGGHIGALFVKMPINKYAFAGKGKP